MDSVPEEWRAIPGYQGYEASNLGRVRSVDRVVISIRNGIPKELRWKGRVIDSSKRKGSISITVNGVKKNYASSYLRGAAFPELTAIANALETRRIEMTGLRFHKLVVIEASHGDNLGKSRWSCRCDCGKLMIVSGKRLRQGVAKSCRKCNRAIIDPLTNQDFRNSFLESVKITRAGCWEWTRNRDVYGYGRVVVNGRTMKAHALSYRMFVDADHKEKMTCHHCDNPSCCYPLHLFVGSVADNVADMNKKGRGQRKGVNNLIQRNIDAILKMRTEMGRSVVDIADHFKVNAGTISRAIARHNRNKIQ